MEFDNWFELSECACGCGDDGRRLPRPIFFGPFITLCLITRLQSAIGKKTSSLVIDAAFKREIV